MRVDNHTGHLVMAYDEALLEITIELAELARIPHVANWSGRTARL